MSSRVKKFVGQDIGQVLISRTTFALRKLSGGPYQFVFHKQADREDFQALTKDLDSELFITEGLMIHATGNTLTVNLPNDIVLWLSCNGSVRNFLGGKAENTGMDTNKLLFSWSARKFFPLP